ncbi:fungal-specific transcription factor domain-containing protein [Hypoxylon sp. FL1284]|nr:fungal-specific transcription factor domain-containing protein [Hypoxylon sp. FL1284]
MNFAAGPEAGNENPISESGATQPPAITTMTARTPNTGRKKGTSCARCRRQKIRCDDSIPSCGHCTRAGQVCIRAHLGSNPDVISHINRTEARLRLLEETLHRVAPDELAKLDVPETTPYPPQEPATSQTASSDEPINAPDNSSIELEAGYLSDNRHLQPTPSSGHGSVNSPSASTRIEASEPLAHEVGLLSLANSKESKYLGPSSGIQLARLIFSAIPQAQGLATSLVTSGAVRSQDTAQAQPFPPNWTSEVDLQHFVDAYFETHHPLHPFLDEDAVADRLEILYTKQSPSRNPGNPEQMPQLSEIESVMSPMHSVQIFLIIALGARILETRLSADFSSERYLATAQARIESLRLALHDTIEGLQIVLLLTLCGFYFENGPNAWFLTSSLIASCLDLGLQRRWVEASTPGTSPEEHRRWIHQKDIRSAIFWSTYSFERNLSVVLGRPLTLRDEAIDVEFPGESTLSFEQHRSAASPDSDHSTFKRPRIDDNQHAAAHYSFRLDRIVAEIKLMLHRVINRPDRFPWPTDVAEWQKEAHAACDSILNELLTHLKRRSRRSTADTTIRSLELKYHHNLMLIHRPSPAIPRPTIESWKICYDSALKTIMIYSDLHRFSKLTNSWLTAHTVFVSGITFVYCVWAQSQIRNETSLDVFTRNATTCATLLKFLGRTWSVAADSVAKFERLVNMTTQAWKDAGHDPGAATPGILETPAAHNPPSQQPPQSDRCHEASQTALASGNMDVSTTVDQYAMNEDLNGFGVEPTSFFTELGDASSWFDLDWILSMSTGPSGEVISYPAPE